MWSSKMNRTHLLYVGTAGGATAGISLLSFHRDIPPLPTSSPLLLILTNRVRSELLLVEVSNRHISTNVCSISTDSKSGGDNC